MEWVELRFLLLFKAEDHNAFSFHWKFSLKWNSDKNHYLSTETFPILERRGRNSAHHYSGCLRRFSKNQLWEVIWTITTLFPCNQWNFFSPIRRTFYSGLRMMIMFFILFYQMIFTSSAVVPNVTALKVKFIKPEMLQILNQ